MNDQATIRFYQPAPALRTAISTYYSLRVTGTAPIEDLLHPEWANIRLLVHGGWSLTFADGRSVATAAPGAVVSGTLNRSVVARGEPGWLVGVGLLPAGWARLTVVPAVEAVDTVLPLAALTGDHADRLVEQFGAWHDDAQMCDALNRFFAARLSPPGAADAALVAAHSALLDVEVRSVQDWAARLGRSPRQLERLTRVYFGLAPKALLRRQRFLRTLASMRDQPPGTWGGLVDDRYVDQPHFIHDFRFFMGMPPRAYFARPSPFMVAAGNARQSLLGTPLQGLHDTRDPNPPAV